MKIGVVFSGKRKKLSTVFFIYHEVRFLGNVKKEVKKTDEFSHRFFKIRFYIDFISILFRAILA